MVEAPVVALSTGHPSTLQRVSPGGGGRQRLGVTISNRVRVAGLIQGLSPRPLVQLPSYCAAGWRSCPVSPEHMPSASAVLLLPLCPPTVPHPSGLGSRPSFSQKSGDVPLGPLASSGHAPVLPGEPPTQAHAPRGLRFTETRSPRQRQPLSLPPCQEVPSPTHCPAVLSPRPDSYRNFNCSGLEAQEKGVSILCKGPGGAALPVALPSCRLATQPGRLPPRPGRQRSSERGCAAGAAPQESGGRRGQGLWVA